MSTSVFSLPVPLILLIHLHLLQYPHANKPEYDHNIFDARVRGFRDRSRTMEDVCYFLVSRIEGTKERVRKAIPTYPCVQPADTTAFRASLAKFLQTLRQNSLSPTAPPGNSSHSSGKTVSSAAEMKSVGWWWKDVVVRKSLLEECAGEKFERLVLALSTHALLKGSAIHPAPDLHDALGHIPVLPQFMGAGSVSPESAPADVRVLRANVQTRSRSNKYSSFSTEKLVAVAESKLRDALGAQWSGPNGHSALQLLADMFELKQLHFSSDTTSMSAPTTIDTLGTEATPPSSLPIAAAHHPATLRELSKRIFPKGSGETLGPLPTDPSRPHAAIVLAERLDAEERMLRGLGDGLARTRKITNQLKARLARQVDNPQSRIDFEPTLSHHAFDVWVRPIQFQLPTHKSKQFGTLCSQNIRLPVYDHRRLPQPETKKSPPHTPRSARQVRTVRTPETVKPQTRYPLGDRRPPSEFVDERGTSIPTPRARQRDSPRLTPFALPSMQALEPYSPNNDDDFGAFDEGPSMSVRDLLLQADTTHFDIIDDDSNELSDQSFGWA
ncbi:hypothetical protein K438DRAFT_2011392 [Mycena galopus ATCC 62051]|nr:hypothetical protein K438DRAFT_2011392 [Mycena galopus ATCC 62051]